MALKDFSLDDLDSKAPTEYSMLASHTQEPAIMVSHKSTAQLPYMETSKMSKSLEELASLGASKYNASGMLEQQRWEKNALERTKELLKGNAPDKVKKNVDSLHKQVDKFSTVFEDEKNKLGITDNDLKKFMTLAYAAETNFGTHHKAISPTGVVGAVQVTTNTFKDLVNNGILGDKAAKSLGYSNREELSNLSDKQIRRILKTDKGSILAGTGKYIQILMTERSKNK